MQGFMHDVDLPCSGIDAGLNYGPTFNGLQSLRVLPCRSTAYGKLAIPNTKTVIPMKFEFPRIIHPATLDCVFHLAFAALHPGGDIKHPAVPVSVG